MNILIVSNLYPPTVFGGYEILCQQVADLLAARGHRLSVLTSKFSAGDTPPQKDVDRLLGLTTSFPGPGQEVASVDFRLNSMHNVAQENYTITRSALTRYKPDVVFCWCMNRLSPGPIFAAQDQGTPVCYTINDEHPRQFRFTRRIKSARALARWAVERWVWPLATFRHLKPLPAVVISKALKRTLLAQDAPVEQAKVVYQGIPLAAFPFKPRPRAEGEPLRLLYVGQLSRTKGVHTILSAAGELLRRGIGNFQLDIVGAGVPGYTLELEKRVGAECLGNRVSFLGKRKHAEIPGIYRQHHVLIFSSQWDEPFGLTHLEAMASGCAVISTTMGGCAELIRHGDNALAFEAGQASDLRTRIEMLMANEEHRMELINAARKCVEAEYSLEGYVDHLEAFLHSTIDRAA